MRSKIAKSLFVLMLIAATITLLVGGGAYWYFSRNLPQIIRVEDYRPPVVTQIIVESAEKSTVIGEFYKERRYVVPFEKIGKTVVQAFLAAEDDQFYGHQGLNLTSIIRAAIANFKAGHVVQGGSTITQQVAKSLLLTPEKSFSRKIKELILAMQMERNLKKEEILYLYLNQIYLGHGAYGVQAAARIYFDKDVSELSIAEAAMIAGMPQAPGKYSPHLNPKKAKERQLYVLRRMYENKWITQEELAQAQEEHLRVHDNVDVNALYSPYYVETIRKGLLDQYGEKRLYEGGMKVLVAGDADLMKKAGEALKEGVREVDQRQGYRGPMKKLKTGEEIEKKLSSLRLELVMKELGYDVLLPDGTISTLEAVQLAGLESEAQLLKQGKVYPGVVTEIRLKEKTATVMVGAVKTILTPDGMEWALKDRGSFQQVIHRGDLVLVKVTEIKKKSEVPKSSESSEKDIFVSLEQEPELQAALFSLDLKTGQVLAMEGGVDFSKSEFNRALQAQRQVGSSFKPIIFSAALEKGFTPASIIVDSPIVYSDEEQGKWKPANFEHKFYGDTPFRLALIKSRNIPTIKIVQEVQIPYLIQFAKRLGMTGQFPNDLSISLGSSNISLSELTRAYAVFPRLGRKINPVYYSKILDRDGNVLEEKKYPEIPPIEEVLQKAKKSQPTENKKEGEGEEEEVESTTELSSQRVPLHLPVFPTEGDPDQVLDPRVAYVTTHLMTEVVSFGTGQAAKALDRPSAGKTGTTNDFFDAWFIGFTPEVVTGVWVGYDAQKQIGKNETGARAALPIWLSFMKEATKGRPEKEFQVPPGVTFVSINPQTGKLAPPNASYAIKEAFIDGTAPHGNVELIDKKMTAPSTSDFLKEDIE